MDEREYERRKIELDRQLEAGIDLLRAGNRSQRTALDLVWAASPHNPRAGILPFEIPLANHLGPLPLPFASVNHLGLPAEPPALAPARRKRWGSGELRAAVETALPRAPAEFDRTDLLAALEAEVDRGSLYRILEDLRRGGAIERVTSGSGSHPSRYRRLDG